MASRHKTKRGNRGENSRNGEIIRSESKTRQESGVFPQPSMRRLAESSVFAFVFSLLGFLLLLLPLFVCPFISVLLSALLSAG